MAEKRKRNNSKVGNTPSKKSIGVNFVSDNRESGEDSSGSLGYMTSQVKSMLGHREQMQELAKSVKPVSYRKDLENKIDKTKVVFSAKEYKQGIGGVEEKGYRRLSDQEQKELAQVDPYVSAIISTRCGQGAIIGSESDSKFDKGSRMYEITPLKLEDYESRAAFEVDQRKRQAQMKAIFKWVFECGTDDATVLDTAFAGFDNTFRKCSLPEFLSAQIRNLLTFGRCGTQIFRNSDGLPIMWRPVPIETIKNLEENHEVSLVDGENTAEQSVSEEKEYNALPENLRPNAYVQQVNGQNVNFFTEDTLMVWNYQKQALFDLNGYPLSPLEMAIYMVFTHQQTLGYLRNQFIKGIGSKGMLVIESVDPSVTLSPEDLEELRRNFHNYLMRNDNSAVTPILSGPVKVNYLSLNPTPKDMEFLQVEEHVIRSLCSAFQISPHEMGYGHLSQSQGGLTASNRQEEIVRGEERGLRTLLDVLYNGLNDLIAESFPEIRDLYRLTYVGVGEDTRDAVVGRQLNELQTTATLSSLWADSEKTDPVPYGGNVPLAPLFHANVIRYMKYGVVMEEFFGEKGAAKNPAYDFIVDPQLNQSYMQNKMMAAQQAQMPGQPGAPPPGADSGQAGNGPPEPPNPAGEMGKSQEPRPNGDNSLRSAFRGSQDLSKSMDLTLGDWIKAHD